MLVVVPMVHFELVDFHIRMLNFFSRILIASYLCFSRGKNNRRDVYQAPYVWAQFTNAKKNVLINVVCRVFAKNINFDRKTSRGLTRFQIFIENLPKKSSTFF